MRTLAAGCLAILCSVFSATASADLTADINRLRRQGCDGRPGSAIKLETSRELDAVAREWSRGGRLSDALTKTNYRAIDSASIHVAGAVNDAAIVRVLADNYCEAVLNPAFTAIGLFRDRKDVRIVVAAPVIIPAASDARPISARVLTLVNEARSKPRKCGKASFEAAPPLTLSTTLTRVAAAHAKDMATHDFFEHEGSDGSTPAQRAVRAGYQWRNIAENIAAGATTADAVVSGWLESPGHCANLMGTQFTEMGIAYATAPKSRAGIYWSQMFGRPKGK